MEFFATCGTGLEAVLGDELRSLGIASVRPLTGGVSFSGTAASAYTALLWSRVASRVLLVVGRVDASNADTLYEDVLALAWDEQIAPGATIAISARGSNDELRDTRFTALRVKDAVCDCLRDVRGQRPDVDAENPDLRIQVHLRAKKATIYIDLSGSSLEDRYYAGAGLRKQRVPRNSTIHPTLAAAMLLAAGWPARAARGGVLCDPQCAAGTIAIEAALIAGDIAPSLTRETWGFFGWAQHDEQAWLALLDAADERAEAKSRACCVYACDARAEELACARSRVKSAGMGQFVEFFEGEAALWEHVPAGAQVLVASSLLVTSELSAASAPAFYAAFAARTMGAPGVDAAVILAADQDVDSFIGIERSAGFDCMHGSAPCACVLFDHVKDAGKRELVRICDVDVPVFDAAVQQFADRLNKMRKQRRKWAKKERISAYRVYDADLPDYNMAIDLYEGVKDDAGKRYVHVAEYAAPKGIDTTKASRRMADALNIICTVFDIPVEDVFVKRRVRAKGGSQYAHEGSAQEGNASLVTQENGLLFDVDLAQYLDTGLFLDHRDVRALVGALASGKSFLNLFAYTCTASVYAAARGAKFTTSVDLSNTYLQWGERNMELNGLMDKHQEFIRANCVEWVQQTRHSKLRWDLVFVDPPTFSNSSKMGKRAWDVQRDHAELLIGVSRLLTRGGAIVFSCNLRGFKLDAQALAKAGVQAVDITEKTIPEDFKRNAKIHHCYVLRRVR